MEHFTAEVQRIRPAVPGQQVIELAADEWLARIIRNRNVRYVAIGIEDGRRITPLQQRKAYATLRDIGEYTGYPMDAIKGIMKVEHMMRTDDIDTYLIQCIRYRRHYDDSQNEIAALCRNHHNLAHSLGWQRFMSRYKVYGIERYRCREGGSDGNIVRDDWERGAGGAVQAGAGTGGAKHY